MCPTLAHSFRAGAMALAAALAVVRLSPATYAAPPSNDTCAGAIVIGGVPYLSPVIDILDATTSGDPTPLPPGTGQLKHSIWFRFVPAASAQYTLSVGEDTATKFVDLNDTVMGLYRSTSACGGPWTLVAENDDSAVVQSAITTNLTAGTTYYIVVWAGQGAQDESQPLYVQLRVTRPVVPSNDLCSGAIAVPTTAFPYVTNIDTLLATDSANETSSCHGNRGVWFTFAPTVAGTYILSMDPPPATSILDPTMTLFTSASGCSGPFTELNCSDRTVEPIVRSLTAATTYYILLGSLDTDPYAGATSVQLRVRPAGPPTVTTLPATSINSTSGVLNMAINANAVQARYFFEWGTTTSYGNLTQNRSLTDVSNTVNTTAVAGPITPGVTYHFRAVGSNAMGKVFGADQTFHYSTNRPVIAGTSFQPGGNFRFQFMGNTNQVYKILTKTDLSAAVQWIDSGPAMDRGGGLYELRAVPTGTRRFYEVRSP